MTNITTYTRLLIIAVIATAVGCGNDNNGAADGGGSKIDAGEARCSGSWVDLKSDPLHCGACDSACALGQVCDTGLCRTIANCTIEPCVGLSYCDLATEQCVPGCIGDSQCSGAQPNCDTIERDCVCEAGSCPTGEFCDASAGTCASGCNSDSQCSGELQHCNTATNSCVCGASSCEGGRYCSSATDTCVAGCDSDTQCSGEQPSCDVPIHSCVCEEVGSCPVGEHCNAPTGMCAAGCLSDAQCSGEQPSCDTANADCVCNADSCSGFQFCEMLTGACTSCGDGVAVSAGNLHTCAVNAGGLKCWGQNGFGQLGDGTTTRQSAPVNVIGMGNGVDTVAGGGNHTCVLLTSGGVKCWGYNNFGQLGNATTVDSTVPVDVTGLTSGVIAIGSGSNHTCALLNGGGVRCWGRLGSQLDQFSTTPAVITGVTSGVAAIAVGNTHGCALLTNGGVKCWGGNFRGQLGDGTTIWRPTTASNVTGMGSGVESITAGGLHSCALLTNGSVKCWGYNFKGQLGDGTISQRNTPVTVNGLGTSVDTIAGGYQHTCAVLTNGGAKCWGWNRYAQLGDGTTTDRNMPVDVSGLTGVTSISLGDEHSCASLGCELKCWGDNYYGQLGDGTRVDRPTATSVVGY